VNNVVIALDKTNGCIHNALDIFGDKWTPLLVRQLTQCPHTFSELEASLVGISPRTLSQRLDKLAAESIIIKDLYCEHPPRYKYSLTEKGAELKAVLEKMAEWGEKYP